MSREWEYYRHALIPATAPHMVPDTSWMKKRKKWRELADGKYPLFARWITDFDCPEETPWWYCIKDSPLDLSGLKYKRRRVIKQGLQNVEVKLIMPSDYSEQMAEITLAARAGYGEKIDTVAERKELTKEFSAISSSEKMANREYTGAFLKATGEMIGYGIYELFEEWVSQSVIKTHPDYLKYNVNAALAYFAVERYMGSEFSVKYISNGARNISHETNYHEYLIKYFGFRKAYCQFHICYRFPVRLAVKTLFPLRRWIYKFNENNLLCNAASVLRMEEISREFHGSEAGDHIL